MVDLVTRRARQELRLPDPPAANQRIAHARCDCLCTQLTDEAEGQRGVASALPGEEVVWTEDLEDLSF